MVAAREVRLWRGTRGGVRLGLGPGAWPGKQQRPPVRASHACYSTRAPVPPCAPAWTEVEDENDEGMLVF